MAFFIGNSYCSICQQNENQLKKELSLGFDGLSSKGIGLDHPFLQSARMPGSNYFWTIMAIKNETIYNKYYKVHLESTKECFKDYGHFLMKELVLHSKIYQMRPDVNTIFHGRSPYLNNVVENGLDLVHAEAALILGDIPIIENVSIKKNESKQRYEDLIFRACVGEPLRPVRIVFLKGNGVLSLGACIHESCAFMEIVEEWARFHVIAHSYAKMIHVLNVNQLRELGSRHSRSIKFGGRMGVDNDNTYNNVNNQNNNKSN